MNTLAPLDTDDGFPKLPFCDPLALSYCDEGDELSRTFKYACRKHELGDMLRLGYFDIAGRDRGLRLWDRIVAVIGADPATANEVTLRVVVVPHTARRVTHNAPTHCEEHFRFAILSGRKPAAIDYDRVDERATSSKTKAAA